MRTLVTGGAGFIGSNVVDALLERGDEVIVMDNLSTGKRENLEDAIAGGAVLAEVDFREAAAVNDLVTRERPDVIFHLGAQIDVRKSVSDPAFDATVNVIGTINMLAAAQAAGVKRFVNSSTGGAIYGEGRVIPAPETEALLFAAARAELVAQVIRPALDDGKVVVSDRFLDSSLAYQGIARGLGVEDVEQINRFATGGLLPDLTILLAIDPQRAAERAGQLDRFEDEGRALQERVARAYEELAAADPRRWHRIDADRPADEIHADVLAAVEAARKVPA